jgi:hypothetical protein
MRVIPHFRRDQELKVFGQPARYIGHTGERATLVYFFAVSGHGIVNVSASEAVRYVDGGQIRPEPEG